MWFAWIYMVLMVGSVGILLNWRILVDVDEYLVFFWFLLHARFHWHHSKIQYIELSSWMSTFLLTSAMTTTTTKRWNGCFDWNRLTATHNFLFHGKITALFATICWNRNRYRRLSPVFRSHIAFPYSYTCLPPRSVY